MADSVLNLVFDKWDGDIPFSNCYDTGLVRKFIKDHIFQNLNVSNFKVVMYKLEEINEDDNFYYLINYSCDLIKIVNEKNFCLGEDVLKASREKNLKIIFFCDH